MPDVNWITKIGGRKFALCVLGVVAVVVLVKLEAPSEAFLTLAGIVGAFVGGNTMVTRTAMREGVVEGSNVS